MFVYGIKKKIASIMQDACKFFIYISSYLPRTAVDPAKLKQTQHLPLTMNNYNFSGGNFHGGNFGNCGTSTVNNSTGEVGDNTVTTTRVCVSSTALKYPVYQRCSGD